MRDVHGRTPTRILEFTGLLAVLASLAIYLVTARSIKPWSDPATWFVFGRNFIEQFGHSQLAYGFPLLVGAAIQLVGPFYAFLINVPLLLLLTLLVHAFSRRLIAAELPRAALVAPFGAAFAVLIFLQQNGLALARLASPYRDPLSHVLVLLACLLVVGFRRGPVRSLGPVVAAGLLMAYACSTRETAVLMLLPLFLFATMAKLEDRALPYAKPLLVFGLAFVVGCIPLLVQNQLVSGNALVPAQASKAFARAGVLTPGVNTIHFADTFPSVVNHLRLHFGAGPLLLCIAGFVAALRYRQGAVLFLCIPAIVIYTLFYGSYQRVVPRYLFVVDLFALPVAGFGAAALFRFVLGTIRDERVQRWVAHVGLAAVLILAAATALRGARFDGRGFHLPEARRLAQDIGRNLPPDVRVIGERTLGRILDCFLDRPVTKVSMYYRVLPFEPVVRRRVRDIASAPSPVYAATTTLRFRRLLASEFDLQPVVVLPTRPYGIERKVHSKKIRIDRVLPWTSRRTRTVVRVGEAGDYILRVDVGQLSKEPRRFTRVRWGEEILDDDPRDGVRYYRVSTESAGPVTLGLESYRPVRGSLPAWIGPIGAPLRLEFKILRQMDDVERFSDGFLVDPDDFPEIPERGSIDVPTVGWEDGFFVFTADVRVDGGQPGWKRQLTIRSGGVRLFDAVLTEGPEKAPRVAHRRFVFWAAPGVVTGNDTRLDWSLGAPDDDASDSARLWIRELVVYRVPSTDLARIDVGSLSDGAFIDGGFHGRGSSDDGLPLRWRWTNGRGRLRLFAWAGDEPLRLLVRTLQGARPAGIASPAPRFRLNGHALTGATRREPVGKFERVTYRFDVPNDWMVEELNLLEIRSRTWVPARKGAEADRRSLGIMLEGVSFEPLPAG